MRLYFTKLGEAALLNAVDTSTPLVINNFKIGESVTYDPFPPLDHEYLLTLDGEPVTLDGELLTLDAPFDPTVMPFDVAYAAGAEHMRKWKIMDNDLAIQCIVPSTANDFMVGHVLLYSNDVPILGGILQAPQGKYTQDLVNVIPPRRIANNIVLTLGLGAVSTDLWSALDLSALAYAHADADDLAVEYTITPAPITRTSLKRVLSHTVTERPALALKDPTHTPDMWIGVALMPIADVSTNWLSGGTMGDGYQS